METSFNKYITNGTDDRMREVRFNFKNLKSHFEKRTEFSQFHQFMNWLDEFRYYFNNYLISIMSIKDTLDKDYKKKIEGYEEWWGLKIDEIKSEFDISFLELRNAHQHENNGFITYAVSVEKLPDVITIHLDYSFPLSNVIVALNHEFGQSTVTEDDAQNAANSFTKSKQKKNISSDSELERELVEDETGQKIPLKWLLIKKTMEYQAKIGENLIKEGNTYLAGVIIKSMDKVISPIKMMEICENLIAKFQSIVDESYSRFYPMIQEKK